MYSQTCINHHLQTTITCQQRPAWILSPLKLVQNCPPTFVQQPPFEQQPFFGVPRMDVVLRFNWISFAYSYHSVNVISFPLSQSDHIKGLPSPLNLCTVLTSLEAIQKIRDTLGGGGVSKNVTGQFLLVILLVKIDKICHMGGGGS